MADSGGEAREEDSEPRKSENRGRCFPIFFLFSKKIGEDMARRRLNLGMINRAFRNVRRKKIRTILVVLALSFTIASITSVYAGIDATNDNTENMIDTTNANNQAMMEGVMLGTQEMINETINSTGQMIDTVVVNTQDMIDDTLAHTQEMINSTLETFQEMENESEIHMSRITVSNMTSTRPPSYSEIEDYIMLNISGLEGFAELVPRIEKSYGENMNFSGPGGMPGQGGGGGEGGGGGRPTGGYKRMKADYVIEGIPLDSRLVDKYHLLPPDVINGSNLSETDSMKVIIHRDLTEYFNASVGDNITIEEINFTVIGIYYSALQNTTVYMNISDARTMLGLAEGGAYSLDVYAQNITVVDNVTDEISFYYPDFDVEAFKDSYASTAEYVAHQQELQIQRLNQDAQTQIEGMEYNKDIQIAKLKFGQEEQIAQLENDKDEQIAQLGKDQEEQVSDMEDDMVLLKTIGSLIIIISTISACIIIIVMMFYTVKERTREIGIFKALGFRANNIVGQFLIEGVIIGFLAGVFGMAISVGAGPLLSDLMLPSSDVYTASRPGMNLVLLVLGLTAILGAVGSFFPARRASRKRAAEAIRNE